LMRRVGIGLIGFGTIGSGVVKILKERGRELSEKVGCDLRIKRIVDKDITSARCVKVDRRLLSTNVDGLLTDPEIDVVIELIGGIHPAKEFVSRALKEGKDVITANKALLAEKGEELFKIASEQGREILFEASVCGGIPILKILKEGLCANRIESLLGIVNGTTNYILTQMEEEGCEIEKALEKAKKEGIAEADASLDIQGIDSQHKICLLSSLIFGNYLRLENIFCEGIERIRVKDLEYARDFGYAIKLLGIVRRFSEKEIGVYVYPALIPQTQLLSKVRGAFNALSIKGDVVGELFFYGKGAGMFPTASAVVADLLDIVSRRSKGKREDIRRGSKEKICLRKIEDLEKSYYIRFLAVDQPGVLAAIARCLGEQKVSIASVIQKEREESKVVPIVMMTHYARERDVQRALKEIDRLPVVKERLAIRIEE